MPDISPDGVQIERRLVPFPASISEPARAYLASLVHGDGSLKMPIQPVPAADDTAGWVAARQAISGMMAQLMSGARAATTSSVKTIDMGGAVVHLATPANAGPDDRAYVDIHGGAFIYGGGEFCRLGACIAADRHGVRCYGIDYRMPPEHPYPAGLDDCMTVYRALLDRYKPENIIVGGASAGANLAAALMLRARDEGLPLPACVVVMSPEIDLTESGDSFETNRMVDVMLPGSLMDSNLLYAAGHDLTDPYLSPLFADFSKGFPPTFLQVGTRDLFLSNGARLQKLLRKARVPVELQLCEAMPHGGFMGAPEDVDLEAEVRHYVAERWGKSS